MQKSNIHFGVFLSQQIDMYTTVIMEWSVQDNKSMISHSEKEPFLSKKHVWRKEKVFREFTVFLKTQACHSFFKKLASWCVILNNEWQELLLWQEEERFSLISRSTAKKAFTPQWLKCLIMKIVICTNEMKNVYIKFKNSMLLLRMQHY